MQFGAMWNGSLGFVIVYGWFCGVVETSNYLFFIVISLNRCGLKF
jgi:hypothetical protein